MFALLLAKDLNSLKCKVLISRHSVLPAVAELRICQCFSSKSLTCVKSHQAETWCGHLFLNSLNLKGCFSFLMKECNMNWSECLLHFIR